MVRNTYKEYQTAPEETKERNDEQMQKLRAEKGITLIALVITIIVMLILVGVSVTVALNGGLFSTAQKATGDTKAERDNELALSDGKVTINGEEYNSIDEYVNGSGNGTGEETLAAGLYKPDGTFVSWEQLTSVDYKSFTYMKYNMHTGDFEESTTGILHVDEYGVLTSCSDDDSGYNLSSDFLEGKLVINDNVKQLGVMAFDSCRGLTSVEIPDGVTIINANAFLSSSITDITIPNSVKMLDEGCFDSCSLSEIFFTGTKAEWNAINISEDVVYSPEYLEVIVHCTDGDTVLIAGG